MGSKKVVTDKLGFLRVDPIPTKEEVNKYYSEEFYATEYKSPNTSALDFQLKQKEYVHACWDDHKVEIEKHFGSLKDVRILDVGCGYGLGMQYLANLGAKTFGFDPAPEAIDYAVSNGVQAVHSQVETFPPFDGLPFDVISFINVLEHLRDPAEALRNAYSRLSPKGMLIVDVPNDFNIFQEVANEKYKLDEWWFCPPAHINYFSPTSLRSLAEKTGFTVKTARSSFPLELFLLMGEVYVGNPELGKKCHNQRVLFEQTMKEYGKQEELNKLYETFADLDIGRKVAIYCTKPTS